MSSLFSKSLWTKELIAWYLYDLANSFVTITMTLYFTQWVVVDGKFSDFWYSLGFIIPTFILIFLSTHVGKIGDLKGTHGKIFVQTTLATFLSVLGIILLGRSIPGPIGVAIALVFFAVYQFFVQDCLS